MAGQTIRVGIVGAGGIVRTRHVPGLGKEPDVVLAAVANSTSESTQRAAMELGIERSFDHWEDLVRWDGIDAVLIGTPPFLHRAVALAALEAGKHVFCQARMAMNAAEARDMLAAAERSDLVTMLCPPPHYLRGDRVVRRLVAGGYLGDLYHVNIRWYGTDYIDPTAPLHWRQTGRTSGVNTLTVGMMLEVMHRWVGPASRVVAQTFTATPQRRDSTGKVQPVDRPDSVSVAAAMQRGGLGSFLFSGIARHAGANTFELYGSAGVLKYDYQADRLFGARAQDAELHEIIITSSEERRWTVEHDWIAAIRSGNRTPEPSFRDGLAYMEATEAIFRSAESGQAVDLPLR
ncbi:MAG: Gfo/Idh/MocA family oxidoreductase [Chloroflexi bacterium]|nr:Gfo/Idh/MocA family oxidoreductase [Chloroflexota bacterium]